MLDIYGEALKEINTVLKGKTKLIKSELHDVATDAYVKGYHRGVKNITDLYNRLSKYDDTELHEIFFQDDDSMFIDANPTAVVNKFGSSAINMLDRYEAKNKKD